jgi:hypothetical protein
VSDEHLLPLAQQALLTRAIGRRLVEIERAIVVAPDWFASEYGDPEAFFTQASGATQLTFSDGLIHTLRPWPSQLSVVVEGEPLPADPYADRHRLSETEYAPGWLRGLVGQEVDDVRVHRYRDDVPSDEARQAAISYVLAGTELFYAMYLHGRMSGDELLRGEDVPRDAVAETVAMGQRWSTS